VHLRHIGLAATLLDPGAAHDGLGVGEAAGSTGGKGHSLGHEKIELTSLRRHDPDQVRRV